MGATPTIYARSRDRWRAYTSNTMQFSASLGFIYLLPPVSLASRSSFASIY
jgi:hypothetical protein